MMGNSLLVLDSLLLMQIPNIFCDSHSKCGTQMNVYKLSKAMMHVVIYRSNLED